MKIVTVVGARPQFVKAAVVSRAIQEYGLGKEAAKRPEEVIVHTGQHYSRNLSDVFFEQLAIPEPRYNIGVGSMGHGAQTGAMLGEIESVLAKEEPQIVLVYGDTNSTLAGALAAVKLHVPVAHVEAGLRSGNRRMPEEINRVVTDHISTWLFCPSRRAVENLEGEGVSVGVHNVGDVMYDCHMMSRPDDREASSDLASLGLASGESVRTYYLATIHRPENTDDPYRLASIFAALSDLEFEVILPLHPRTHRALEANSIRCPDNVRLIEPVSYSIMKALQMHARAILTDSGGIQKEAFFLGIPCVTMRDETEWEETVDSGWNVIAGADREAIVAAVQAYACLDRSEPEVGVYGDGNASAKIVSILAENA